MNTKKDKIQIMRFIKFFGLVCLTNFISVNAEQIFEQNKTSLDASYLESKRELEDYILDTGDFISIQFKNLPELSGTFGIDAQGEIYLKRLKEINIRGLTIDELEILLAKAYKDILINPEIEIIVRRFKPIRVSIRGEVRNPGLKKFDGFTSSNEFQEDINQKSIQKEKFTSDSLDNSQLLDSNTGPFIDAGNGGLDSLGSISSKEVRRSSDFVTTLSNLIKQAGGLTSYSDISKIEVFRDIPLGKGGGRKKAILDLRSYINGSDSKQDIRLFDGDLIFIPRLAKQNPKIIPKSILAGLTPRFIFVNISGKIESTGQLKLPIEASLSDAMNLAGPRKPLSGKVFLIRYEKDGSLLRQNIKYIAKAIPGSKNNPYLVSGDLINVQNSIFGRSTSVLRAFTEPFIGIYATKEVLEIFAGE